MSKLKLFCDFHHGGLARSMWYLFGDRLGYEIRFPHYNFTHDVAPGGVWNELHEDGIAHIGEWDGEAWRARGGLIEKQEFLDTKWDIILVTRHESMAVFKSLGHPKPGVKYIGVAGNENIFYDSTWIPNLLSTDCSTYRNAPADVYKILTGQELGRQYGKTFVPVTAEALHKVNTYLNNMTGHDVDFTWGCDAFNGCPHCEGIPRKHEPVNLFKLWESTRKATPDYQWGLYGHFNDNCNGRAVIETELAAVYASAALTWHYKTAEGWGHSLLQSIACGRPVIVPEKFFRYKNAGRYLIPEQTCFECDYTAENIAQTIRRVTADIDTANHYAKRCWDVAHTLFDWSHEAWRVKKWMENLR